MSKFKLMQEHIDQLLPYDNVQNFDLVTASRSNFTRWFRDKVEIVKGPFGARLPKGHGLVLPRAEQGKCFYNAGHLFAENDRNSKGVEVEVWTGLGVFGMFGSGVCTPHMWNRHNGHWLDRSWKDGQGEWYCGVRVPKKWFWPILGIMDVWGSVCWHYFAYETALLKGKWQHDNDLLRKESCLLVEMFR